LYHVVRLLSSLTCYNIVRLDNLIEAVNFLKRKRIVKGIDNNLKNVLIDVIINSINVVRNGLDTSNKGARVNKCIVTEKLHSHYLSFCIYNSILNPGFQ